MHPRAFLAVLLAPAPLFAQAPAALAPDAAIKQANALFDAGRPGEAADAYAKFLKDYPTANQVVEAGYRLGNALFLAGRWDEAAAQLRKMIASQTSPPEVVEACMGLLPAALAQKAASLPATDAKRKAAFEESIKEAGAFLTKYPNAAEVEGVRYGRAAAQYQIGNYPAAAEDLKANLAAFTGRSESYQDSQYLLALTFGTQGNFAFSQQSDRAAATRAYLEAEKLLADIVAKRTDLALANDAQFQLGEILLARAATAASEAERAPVYQQALTAFRGVQPKTAMVAAQQERINGVLSRMRAAAGNALEARRLGSLRNREAQKLGVLNARDDQRLTALLKCGEVWFQLGRHDEARVLLTALAPRATKPEQERIVLFYTAMSYAAQGQIEKAIAGHDKFVAKFKDDPMAASLALTIGNLLNSKGDAARAQKYLDEASSLAPKGQVAEFALLERARSLAAGGKFDEAIKVFDDFLKGNPKPEAAVVAELGRARILRDKGDLAGALAAFTKLRDTAGDKPQGEEAAFFVGLLKSQQKDAAGAVADLRNFVAKYPKSQLAPGALLTVAQTQRAAGQKELALTTLQQIPAQYPQSKEAGFAFFQRADIAQAENKPEQVIAVLQEFIAKFPADEKVFAAIDAIANVQVRGGKIDDAAAAYQGFLEKNPQSPNAATALRKIGDLYRNAAQQMGRYAGLDEVKKKTWAELLQKAVAAVEQLVAKYPKEAALALGLETFNDVQQLQVDAGVKPAAEVNAAFTALAGKAGGDKAATGRIAFRAAVRGAAADPAKAAAALKENFDPALAYSAASLDTYGQALLKSGDVAGAETVYRKLQTDFPNPAGAAPTAAPKEVQEAQATALYGLATVATAKKDTAAAGALFDQLKKLYPWSPKIAEANLGIALNLKSQGKNDEAVALLAQVARATTAPPDVRARGMLATAQIFQATNNPKGAIDTYLKIAQFYPTTPQAAEGLLIGAKLLEQQAGTVADAAEKARQLGVVRKAYEDLLAKHPSAPGVDEARQRLSALPK
ncbi:MAG: tetratricopeptide repeat protein [Verrucomicrobia bacterium]|nr:tetratricopeptide repeat protein [Verrucomicrobiota bacterium]